MSLQKCALCDSPLQLCKMRLSSFRRNSSTTAVRMTEPTGRWALCSDANAYLFSSLSHNSYCMPNNYTFVVFVLLLHGRCRRFGDGAGNTAEENSSVFSLIRMR